MKNSIENVAISCLMDFKDFFVVVISISKIPVLFYRPVLGRP